MAVPSEPILFSKATSAMVGPNDNISCVNLFPHCLWESITTFINDKQVSDTGT